MPMEMPSGLSAAPEKRSQSGARGQQGLGLGNCRYLVRFLQPQRELVTAEAGGNVAGPAALGEEPGKLLEHQIALGVPVHVVNRLEVVEIDHCCPVN